jgi:tetratricopeptide (TPR) repeat protein
MKNFFLLFVCVGFIACENPTPQVLSPSSGDESRMIQSSLDSLSALIISDSLNSIYYFERAELYLSSDHLVKGTQDLYKAVELDSSQALYWEKIGNLNFVTEASREAKNAWERCAKLNVNNITCRLSLAEIYLAVEEYKKGERHITDILNVDDKNSSALFLMGNYALAQLDTTKALKYIQAAINNNQNFFKAYDLMGVLYSAKNNLVALDYFNSALRLQPQRSDIHYKVGLFYQNMGAYLEALEAYDRAIQVRSDYQNAYHNKGVIYIYTKQFSMALEALTKAIDINPSYLEAYYARAYAYELIGARVKSESDYRTCIMLDPSYLPAMDGITRLETLD